MAEYVDIETAKQVFENDHLVDEAEVQFEA